MSRLFLSYRRDDCPDAVKLIHERLQARLPQWEIFYDHKSIPAAADFPEQLRREVTAATVVLVIVGPRWLELLLQRQYDPVDFAREEVRLALEGVRTVLPVPVQNARMPSPGELAGFPELVPLTATNARRVRPDPDFENDIEALLAALEPLGPGVGVGTVLDRKYELTQSMGEGGMGVVFRARQIDPERTVAVKLIRPGMDSREILARFDAERHALAMMNHPNIAAVIDAGQTPAGRPYFVMEFVDGEPITEYCDRKRLATAERLALFARVCDAVQHAHIKQVIHRDIKPTNVLVEEVEGLAVPKVIDFGLARVVPLDLAGRARVSEAGRALGTLVYSSPEQAAGRSRDIDTRSDVYSLGALLYELLAGEPPFTCAELARVGDLAMQRRIAEEEPSKPSTKLSSSDSPPAVAANRRLEPAKLAQRVRGELDWIVMKALEKRPEDRYGSATSLADDIRNHLRDETISVGKPSPLHRVRKFVRRNRWPTIAASVLFAVVTAGITGTTWGLWEAKRQSDIALGETIKTEAALRREAEEKANRERVEFEAIVGTALQLGQVEKSVEAFDRASKAGVVLTSERRLDYIRALAVLDDRERLRAELDSIPIADLPRAIRGRFRVWEAVSLWGVDDALAEKKLNEALKDGLPKAEKEYVDGVRAASTPEAIAHFRRAIDYDWLHYPSRSNACVLLLLLGRLDEAAALAEQSIIVMPRHADFRTVLAVALALKGDEKGALSAADGMPEELAGPMREIIPLVAIAPRWIDPAPGAVMPNDFTLHFLMQKMLKSPRFKKLLGGGVGPKNLSRVFGALPPAHREILEVYGDLTFASLRDLAGGALFAAPGGKPQDPQALSDRLGRILERHPEGLLGTFYAAGLYERAFGEVGGPTPDRLLLASRAFERAASASSLVPTNRSCADLAVLVRYMIAAPRSKYPGGISDPALPFPPRTAEVDRAVAGLRQRISKYGMPSADKCQNYFRLALIGRQAGLARDILDHWQSLAPKDPDLMLCRALLDYRDENYAVALRSADAGLAAKPNDERLVRLRNAARRMLEAEPAPTPRVVP